MASTKNDCDFRRDCLKAPIPQKCFNFCIYQILKSANRDEKQFVIGLSYECSNAIYYTFSNHSINSFDDLAHWLSDEHIVELIERFKKIAQVQVDYFHSSKNFRDKMRELLRQLRNRDTID